MAQLDPAAGGAHHRAARGLGRGRPAEARRRSLLDRHVLRERGGARRPAASTRPADTGDTPAPDASGTPGQQSPDNADLTTGITVHNGTAVSGLAGRTRSKLGNDGFTSVNVADGVYGATDPATTTVFYAAPENASTARTVADSLGVTNVVESAEEASSNPIVVVLRDDYQE